MKKPFKLPPGKCRGGTPAYIYGVKLFPFKTSGKSFKFGDQGIKIVIHYILIPVYRSRRE